MRNIVIAAMVAGLALTGTSEAQTAKISQQCNVSECTLIYNGEIQPGDAKNLERAIIAAPAVVGDMDIASPGGDPFEALSMSAVLNKYFVMLFPGNRNGNGQLMDFVGSGDCASACALMFLTTDQRFGSEVFLHRPTFTAEVFRAIPDNLAERAYNAKTKKLLSLLRRRGVSDALLETMMSIPSDSLQKLAPGYPDSSPWFQEWLAAKCGGDTAYGEAFLKAFIGGDAGAAVSVGAHETCKSNAISAARNLTQHKKKLDR